MWRGFPVPYIAMIDDNDRPDFRVTDERKRRQVMQNAWCQLCGKPLGKFCFFTGGADAAKANRYYEPACHLDCLVYAMQVCPFIIGKIEHMDANKIAARHEGTNINVVKEVLPARCPWWVIKKSTGWDYEHTSDSILIVPHVRFATTPLHPQTMTNEDWNKVFRQLTEA